jgi:hypothetical protein
LRGSPSRHLLSQAELCRASGELIGNFKNTGAKWDRAPVLVNDHDFPSDASGVGISYGIYDPPHNRGTVCVGISHDTAAFAAHSIATWHPVHGPA